MPFGIGTYGSSVGRPKKRRSSRGFGMRGIFNRLINRRRKGYGKKKILNSGDTNQGNNGSTYSISDQP